MEPFIIEGTIPTALSTGTEPEGVGVRGVTGDNRLGSAPVATSITGGNLRLDEGCHCFFVDMLCERGLDDRLEVASSSELTCTLWLRISFASVCTPND
jgi:hypothetical protein